MRGPLAWVLVRVSPRSRWVVSERLPYSRHLTFLCCFPIKGNGPGTCESEGSLFLVKHCELCLARGKLTEKLAVLTSSRYPECTHFTPPPPPAGASSLRLLSLSTPFSTQSCKDVMFLRGVNRARVLPCVLWLSRGPPLFLREE